MPHIGYKNSRIFLDIWARPRHPPQPITHFQRCGSVMNLCKKYIVAKLPNALYKSVVTKPEWAKKLGQSMYKRLQYTPILVPQNSLAHRQISQPSKMDTIMVIYLPFCMSLTPPSLRLKSGLRTCSTARGSVLRAEMGILLSSASGSTRAGICFRQRTPYL